MVDPIPDEGQVGTFSVRCDASTGQVWAAWVREPHGISAERAALMAALQAAGLAGCETDEDAVLGFLEACKAPEGPVETVIGRREDGHFDLTVSPDGLETRLTISAPKGGAAVSLDAVRQAMEQARIIHGVNDEALVQAVESGECQDRVIAQGVPPQEGTSSRFDSLLETLRRAPDLSDHAVVDYRELGNLVLVQPGTPLMRRVPAVPGEPGRDVRGEAIAPAPVQDTPFDPTLTGVQTSPDDPDLLLAAIAGAPKLAPAGVHVNPLINVENVDLDTGNIEFDGTLQVKGDVKATMKIRVTGDLVVLGTIEAADIDAGGDVVVKGGIIGKAQDQTDGTAAQLAVVRCQGSVHAKFIEHARIEAALDIFAEVGARQSELVSGTHVLIGKPGAKKGSLVGGQTSAFLGVVAPVLGNDVGAGTWIQVGVNPFLQAEYQRLEAQVRQQVQELAKLRQLLDFLDRNPARKTGDLYDRALNTRHLHDNEVSTLNQRLRELGEEMSHATEATIEATQGIHAGVTVQIGAKSQLIKSDRSKSRITLVQGSLVFS